MGRVPPGLKLSPSIERDAVAVVDWERRSEVDRGTTLRSALRPSHAAGWILAAILAVAALPRVVDALRYPLIFDEIYSVLLARMGLHGLLRTLALDVDQPLSFVLVWAWRALGGEGQLWLKLPSLALALGTVAIVAKLGRDLFGQRVGLLAAALLALQPTHVLYSQQARFHALVWFLLTLALWLATRWIERPTRSSAIGFVLASAAAFYTDFFSFFVVASIGVWGLIRLRSEPARLARWLLLCAMAALLYLPQSMTFLVQLQRDIAGERHLAPMAAGDLIDFGRKLAYNAAYLMPPLLLLAAWPLGRRASRRSAAALWLVSLLPIAAAWGLSVAGVHLFIARQMLFTLPLWCLLIAAGIVALPWRALSIVGAVIALGLAGRSCLMRSPLGETVELPRAIDYLQARAAPGDWIVCGETRALLYAWHYLPDRDVRLLDVPGEEPFHYSDGILVVPEARRVALATLERRIASGRGWWGLRLEHAGRDGPRAAKAFDAAARGERQSFGRVTVWEGDASAR